jgi:hypothetical protein
MRRNFHIIPWLVWRVCVFLLLLLVGGVFFGHDGMDRLLVIRLGGKVLGVDGSEEGIVNGLLIAIAVFRGGRGNVIFIFLLGFSRIGLGW